MATPERARMASESGVVGKQRCCGDPRRRFAPTTPGLLVVDAHRTHGWDVLAQILLWPPKYAHEWPVQEAWLGSRDVVGTPAVGLHPPLPVDASWTPTIPVVWTSLATFFYGHPSTPTNGQCKRRPSETEKLGGPPPSLCTDNTRWSRRGRASYPSFGLLKPATSMATHERARMAKASDVTRMPKFWEDPRLLFAPTTPGVLDVDPHRALGFDVFGQILLWPAKYTHEWPVQAALLGCGSGGETPAVGLHPPHPVVASWMPTVPVVMSSKATLFYGHPSTGPNGQYKRSDWMRKF